MKSGLFKILALSCAAAVMMLLAACGEKAPQTDVPEVDPVDSPQTEAADVPEKSPTVSEDQPVEPPVEDTPPEPDEELRYDVKEVLLYRTSWHADGILAYPDKAVQLSNAQINGLLDKLSALDFSEANGEPVLGGTPVVCTIVTDDEKYCLDFTSGIITIWQSEEELYTLEGRKHWRIYNFRDDPIFEYVRELHNAVKPDGIEPIF